MRTTVVRALAVLALVAVAVGLGYAAARYTSLFALRELEVSSGSPAVDAAVREAGGAFLGESLVALDSEAVRDRIAALPSVRAVRLDRAFPHTLRVTVVPEQPLAVVRNGQEAWLVSDRGRVIRAAPAATGARPLIWTASEPDLRPGASVEGERVLLALRALREVPPRFPERIATARADAAGITFVLAGGSELRLGAPDQLALKLAVAAKILGQVTAAEQAELAYLDVSVPERAVGGASLNSQLEG
ncbi:MAG TPA: FtsQ-type POTRA domain-containing protein [Gaiellaceae bacterium]|nr:FtsQ-type POTRA domain-containing protein [Gaiellaceae bacterium]